MTTMISLGGPYRQYKSRDGRFVVFRHPDSGKWIFFDLAWSRTASDVFDTLTGAREHIARTLARPNEGRPG